MSCKERVFFPDGTNNVNDTSLFYDHALASEYLLYYPGYEVDTSEIGLIRAKLAAAATVSAAHNDGIDPRPNLALAISERNYPEGHTLEVTSNRLVRVLNPGKSKALSAKTVAGYAERYGRDGMTKLVVDLARSAMTALQLDAAELAVQLEIDLGRFVDQAGLAGAQRSMSKLSRFAAPFGEKSGSIALTPLDERLEAIITIINRLGKQGSLGGRALDEVTDFATQAGGVLERRTSYPFANLADRDESVFTLVGYNNDTMKDVRIVPPQRDKATVRYPALSPEELAAREVAEVDTANELFKLAIETIASQYNDLVAKLYCYTKKQLRDLSVVGDDSVVGRMRVAFPDTPLDILNSAAALYAGLTTDTSQISTAENLSDLLDRSARLKEEYNTACAQIIPGGSRYTPPQLTHDIAQDMAWLIGNLEEMYVSCIASCRPHIAATSEGAIDRAISLLDRLGKPDAPEFSASNEPISESAERTLPDTTRETLDHIKARAQTVEWTIMPSDHLTIDDLKEIMSGVQPSRDSGDDTPADANLLADRLAMIIQLREEYEAELFYSSKKMFDESGNFYFALLFVIGGKKFAIAENPTYGNATYVMAEHLMPLLPEETLLTVVKELSRRDIRGLNGRQVIHSGGETPHVERVRATVQQLSGLSSLV